MDEKTNGKNIVNMTDREKLSVTGVQEVFTFDENVIELQTNHGNLDIKGEGLHIIKMNIDEGDIVIEGLVSELIYHDHAGLVKRKSSIMGKLFK